MTNTFDPVIVTPTDRRFAVFDVRHEYRNNQEFFKPLVDAIEYGLVDGFY